MLKVNNIQILGDSYFHFILKYKSKIIYSLFVKIYMVVEF